MKTKKEKKDVDSDLVNISTLIMAMVFLGFGLLVSFSIIEEVRETNLEWLGVFSLIIVLSSFIFLIIRAFNFPKKEDNFPSLFKGVEE